MFKRMMFFGALSILLVSLTGCAGTCRKNAQSQELSNQAPVLESQAPSTAGIQQLTSSQMATTETAASTTGPWTRPTHKEIQTALSNAGYNPGSIDGKIGKQTRAAIRQFQKANNLAVDGRVGRKTWDMLKGYLEKKVK